MQIGAWYDPGLRALLYGDEGSELIVPPCFVLTASSAKESPRHNTIAAVGYLLMRMADYRFGTVLDVDSPVADVPWR